MKSPVFRSLSARVVYVIAAAAIAACGGGPNSSPVPSGQGGDVSAWATATGACDQTPVLTVVKAAAAPSAVQTQDLCEGHGDPVTTQTTITANFIAAVLRNGALVNSTWNSKAPVTTQLKTTLPGWQKGIVGMKVHGRRLIIIPNTLAYGAKPPTGTPIRVGDSLVLLVQIEDAK